MSKYIKIDESKDSSKHITLIAKIILFLTFIFKGWLLAEMQYMVTGDTSGTFSIAISYIVVGAIPFLLFLLANWLAYSGFSKSKYCPVTEDLRCMVNKKTFCINLCIITGVSNLIAGALNFIAYYYSVSITLVLIVIPVIMSIFTSVTMLITLIAIVGRKNARGLVVSMCGPSFMLMALLR